MLSPNVRDRLINWKFRKAWYNLQDDGPETADEREVIHALAALFGNAGWGMEGNMGVVLEALIDRLVQESESVDGSS